MSGVLENFSPSTLSLASERSISAPSALKDVRRTLARCHIARWIIAYGRVGGRQRRTKTKGLQHRIGASSRGREASLTGWFNLRSKQHAIVRSNDRSVIERSAGRINQSQLQDRTRVRPYTCTVLWSNETKPFRNKRISYTARTKPPNDALYVQDCVCVCVVEKRRT